MPLAFSNGSDTLIRDVPSMGLQLNVTTKFCNRGNTQNSAAG